MVIYEKKNLLEDTIALTILEMIVIRVIISRVLLFAAHRVASS